MKKPKLVKRTLFLNRVKDKYYVHPTLELAVQGALVPGGADECAIEFVEVLPGKKKKK